MKKKLNSNIYVMQIDVTIYMRCSIAILFTCLLVLSRSVGKGGFTHETLNVGTNNKILGGPRQTKKIHEGEN